MQCFKPRISGSRRKSSGDGAGTAKKRFMTQEMARRFSLCEEVL